MAEKQIVVKSEDRYDLNFSGVNGLIKLQKYAINKNVDYSVVYDLKDNKYISPAFAVVLGAMPLYRTRKKLSTIKYSIKGNINLLTFFYIHGIFQYYGLSQKQLKQLEDIETDNDAVVFQEIKNENEAIVKIIEILDHAPVTLDQNAINYMIGNIFEIFSNALGHSKNEIGVFVSGHWGIKRDVFIFSVYDSGIGICESVNQYMSSTNQDRMSDEEALKWALVKGHSTNTKYPRGLGLNRLETFIRLNGGEIFLVTNKCCYRYANGKRDFELLEESFYGTLFTVCIKTDTEHLYTASKGDKS